MHIGVLFLRFVVMPYRLPDPAPEELDAAEPSGREDYTHHVMSKEVSTLQSPCSNTCLMARYVFVADLERVDTAERKDVETEAETEH